ncbi:FKBP-type peptidyl-prolyl cis-trans isomerase [Magnetococcus sp. PR-3]|uniref:FKBP-type peptidyl-prolyl cis-trans isomerase n=1 Tax=Magnetococcus sp. PR-3 TaxID=3120355 RepID=UPI002FCE55A6
MLSAYVGRPIKKGEEIIPSFLGLVVSAESLCHGGAAGCILSPDVVYLGVFEQRMDGMTYVMKSSLMGFCVAVTLLPGLLSAETLMSKKDKLSYALGVNLAQSLAETGFDIDTNTLLMGIRDKMTGQSLKMQPQDMKQALRDEKLRRRAELAKMKAAAQSNNLKEAEDFLKANGRKSGVRTTMSGLQYKVLKAGTGPKPASKTSKVKVHYEGRLLDGTVFDSSYKRGEPIEFALNQVVQGWTEGLQLMNSGSIYELYLPPHLAYGERGRPPVIGQNKLLIFKVELIQSK